MVKELFSFIKKTKKHVVENKNLNKNLFVITKKIKKNDQQMSD